MILSDEERKAIVEYRIEKAFTVLNDAEKIAAIKLWSSAANRLYYSLYYAATALLISDGHVSHTHSGMITLFGQNYVLKGPLSKEDGKLMKRIFDLRQEADYDDFIDADEDDVMMYLPKVKELVQKIVALIKK